MAHRQPWLATYADFGIPAAIDVDPARSVTQLLDEAMQTYADKPAFHCEGRTLTFRDVDRLSTAFCAYLQVKLGVKKSDRVAVMLPNVDAFPVAMCGILRAGAVQVNVNPLYTARELAHQLNDSGATVIVIFDDAMPTLSQAIGKTEVQTVIRVGGSGGVITMASSQAVIDFDDMLEAGRRLQRSPVKLNGDDLIFLQYTGGTTGPSKGAALSHRNLVANTQQFHAFMPEALCPGREVVVTAVPMYHILALMVNLISYFSVGAENWLVPNPRDMDAFINILKQARCTIFVGVNTLFNGMTVHPRIREVDFSGLKLAAGGGASVMPSTSVKWKELTGHNIKEGYGLSETSPILTINPMAIEEFSSTVGLPVPSTDIKLLDDKGVAVEFGEPGEVCAKGPQVMRGYWQKPAENALAFTEDGYFRTGDIGVMDDRGFLRIVDRKKDMILVSGFNVYPTEVETVVSAMDGVLECACVGVPSTLTGEAVVLFVVRTDGSTLTEESVTAYCRAQLAAYKVPKTLRFVTTLPKSNVGKVLRRELRDAA